MFLLLAFFFHSFHWFLLNSRTILKHAHHSNQRFILNANIQYEWSSVSSSTRHCRLTKTISAVVKVMAAEQACTCQCTFTIIVNESVWTFGEKRSVHLAAMQSYSPPREKTEICVKECQLPRELWIMILGQFEMLPLLRCYATVCSAWRGLVAEAVSSIAAHEARWLTDDSVKHYPSIRTLFLPRHMNGVTDEGLRCMMNLTSLILKNKKFSDQGVSGLTNLTELVLGSSSRVTNNGLAPMVSLRTLELYSEIISDVGIMDLLKLTSLASYSDNITDVGFIRLTNLTRLKYGGNSMTDAGMQHLVNLTSLDLSGNSSISNEGITGLSNLSILTLDRQCNITNAGIHSLSGSLKSLRLIASTRISDNGVECLSGLTELKVLYVPHITERGISSLVALRSLNLRTDHAFSDVAFRSLTNLTELVCPGYPLTSAAFEPLTNLTSICIDNTERVCRLLGDPSFVEVDQYSEFYVRIDSEFDEFGNSWIDWSERESQFRFSNQSDDEFDFLATLSHGGRGQWNMQLDFIEKACFVWIWLDSRWWSEEFDKSLNTGATWEHCDYGRRDQLLGQSDPAQSAFESLYYVSWNNEFGPFDWS